MDFFKKAPDYTIDDVKNAMELVGIGDPKVHEGFYLHFSSVGWLDGVGRPIRNLRSFIQKHKNSEFIYKLRTYAVKPDKKPIIKERQNEAVKLGDIATLEQRKEIARKAGLKK